MNAAATVVYVAYGVESLDLEWIPADIPVVVVHNDIRLPLQAHRRPGLTDLGDGTNVGFGAAINLALPRVATPRVILCNPDTRLGPEHFGALVDAPDDELVTVPLVDSDGIPNSVVNGYWNAPAFLATALRLGRFAPRHGRVRRIVGPLLGRWGRGHVESLGPQPGTWPLSTRWASGAVLSIPTEALRAVGGFDDRYFLYYEDTDLQQRLAASNPSLRLRLADVSPAVHEVGGSIDRSGRGSAAGPAREVERIRRRSARRYADRQPGLGWRLAGAVVGFGGRIDHGVGAS